MGKRITARSRTWKSGIDHFWFLQIQCLGNQSIIHLHFAALYFENVLSSISGVFNFANLKNSKFTKLNTSQNQVVLQYSSGLKFIMIMLHLIGSWLVSQEKGEMYVLNESFI